MNQPSEPESPSSATPAPVNPQSKLSDSSERANSSPVEPTSDADSALARFRRGVASTRSGASGVDAEETLWHGGYSSRAMTGVWIAAAIGAIVLIAVSLIYETVPWYMALGLAAAIWLIAGAVYASRRLGIHYELTTQRIIHQHGLISRRTERIEVIDIEDVSFSQGPVERMLGIGTIDITSTDRSHPHLVMPGIAQVKTVASLIDDVRRRERQRRSLHIRSM